MFRELCDLYRILINTENLMHRAATQMLEHIDGFTDEQWAAVKRLRRQQADKVEALFNFLVNHPERDMSLLQRVLDEELALVRSL